MILRAKAFTQWLAEFLVQKIMMIDFWHFLNEEYVKKHNSTAT